MHADCAGGPAEVVEHIFVVCFVYFYLFVCFSFKSIVNSQ